MSRCADNSFWRFEIQEAFRNLNLGHVEDLVRPAPIKRQGHAVEMQRWRLRALQHVLYLKGKGFKKHRALAHVSEAIGQSTETLRSWEKALREDPEFEIYLWCAEAAGVHETELDAGPVLLDEHGYEAHYRNASLMEHAKRVLREIREQSLADVRAGLRKSRLANGE
jgi:hypothetical protein